MTDIRIYRIGTLVFTAASNERTRQADASETLADFQDAGLIELIVNQGVGAIDKLPAGIKKDREGVAETITNNMRKLIIDERLRTRSTSTRCQRCWYWATLGVLVLIFAILQTWFSVQFDPESRCGRATGK